MNYLPHTDDERLAMLETIGVARLEDLFVDVPKHLRFPTLDLPPACSEMDIDRDMRAIANRNVDAHGSTSFLGAGVYDHYRPPTVDYVLQRGEFYTSYTPYQPELSQGMLQAMFEYQSMICRLTGMEVSNASHYDGATSLAEAVLLAVDAAPKGRRKVILSPSVHPQYRAIVKTYLRGTGASPVDEEDLTADLGSLKSRLDDQTAALVIQNPNLFGQFENVEGFGRSGS